MTGKQLGVAIGSAVTILAAGIGTVVARSTPAQAEPSQSGGTPSGDVAALREDLHALSDDIKELAKGQHGMDGRLSNIEGYLQGQREAEMRRGR